MNIFNHAISGVIPEMTPQTFCFLSIFHGFGVSHWRPFWITFWYFIWFEVPKITSGPQTFFLMIFELKILWFLMSSPLKSTVNTYVFMRFHFFDFFVILMTSGTSWDLILDTFGGLETPFWWFLGVLVMHWNFIDFLDHPKLRLRTWWKVKWSSRGYSRTVTNPRLLTCRPANSRLITSWWINCWFVNGNCKDW